MNLFKKIVFPKKQLYIRRVSRHRVVRVWFRFCRAFVYKTSRYHIYILLAFIQKSSFFFIRFFSSSAFYAWAFKSASDSRNGLKSLHFISGISGVAMPASSGYMQREAGPRCASLITAPHSPPSCMPGCQHACASRRPPFGSHAPPWARRVQLYKPPLLHLARLLAIYLCII